ncbi:YraN family protein [Asticcacaulis sp.]|uniref:YraN family protein n=1 Tax=Asticcacaulis sp. TaxID=1872648 RepID=UPI002BCCA135|nr:YraN family protein [Asticcacaulis sp.]HTM80432.1 YraN family protein [Asticcacaulis sp.]
MDRALRGAKAHKRGHLAEYIALAHLMLKGYRILGFRLKMPQGEIDILAQKSRRLHLVEVKQRRSHEEAIETVSSIQQERLWQAGLALQEKKPRLRKLDLVIDLYTIAPGQWPRHQINAFEKIERF